MRRFLTTIVAAGLLLSGAFGTASVAAAAPPKQDESFWELFEVRWGGPADPTFIYFPRLVTPLTPDGAWICFVPGECLRSTSIQAVKDFEKYLEDLDEKEKKEEKDKKNSPPPAGGGGVGGGGGYGSLGGGITIMFGSSGSGGSNDEERYGEVGEVENIR